MIYYQYIYGPLVGTLKTVFYFQSETQYIIFNHHIRYYLTLTLREDLALPRSRPEHLNKSLRTFQV